MKLLQPCFFFFFLLRCSSSAAAAGERNADGAVTIQSGETVEEAPRVSDTMSVFEGQEKHRQEALNHVDSQDNVEGRPLSGRRVPYFFRIMKDNHSKKKVLAAFIPSKRMSFTAFCREIIREISKALPYPLSSIFNSSNESTRDVPVAYDEGRVHEIFNMMGCKKETVKYTSSDESLETWMLCTLVRLFPTFCVSILCLILVPYAKKPVSWMKIFLCAVASFCFVFGSSSLFESCPALLSSQGFLYRFYGLWLLVAVEAYLITMEIPNLKQMQWGTKPESHLSPSSLMSTGEKKEEAQEEDKAGESSNVASPRTDVHQWSHTHELASNQGRLQAIVSGKSNSAGSGTCQDNKLPLQLNKDVSDSISANDESRNFPSDAVELRIDESAYNKLDEHASITKSSSDVQFHHEGPWDTFSGHGRPNRRFSKWTSTVRRNCSRFCMFLVVITLVIIMAFCYTSRRISIQSTDRLESTASKNTQEFKPHTSNSKVLLPTRNVVQTEGKEEVSGVTGSTENADWFRESQMFSPSGTTDVKLRTAVPVKKGFHEFIKVYPKDNHTIVTGFVVDVFNEVTRTLPNQVSWEFIPYETGHQDATGYYDKLTYQISLKHQSYDAVVGDVTMTAKRSSYGDFSLPYMSSGVSMIVPIQDDNDVNSLWWFFKPLSAGTWIMAFVFFLLKGILLWFLEHKENIEFQGTIPEQVGTMISFSFPIITSIQKEKLKSGPSKFIVDLWGVSIFIIAAAYNANLSMMLSNGTPQVTNADIETLIENGDNVGYQNGSFVFELLKQWGFHESKLKAYGNEEEYAKALSLGSGNNGVSAIIDEIPYIRVFLTRYGHGYAMGGLSRIITGSFGFVFPKDSRITHEISRAILQSQELGTISRIRERWFEPISCSGPTQAPGTFKQLGFHNFRGLLLITGPATGAALLLPLVVWWYKCKKDVFMHQCKKILSAF